MPWHIQCRGSFKKHASVMHKLMSSCSQLPVERKKQPSPCKPEKIQKACTTNMWPKTTRSPPEGSPPEGSRIKQLASFVGEVSEHTRSCKNGTTSLTGERNREGSGDCPQCYLQRLPHGGERVSGGIATWQPSGG